MPLCYYTRLPGCQLLSLGLATLWSQSGADPISGATILFARFLPRARSGPPRGSDECGQPERDGSALKHFDMRQPRPVPLSSWSVTWKLATRRAAGAVDQIAGAIHFPPANGPDRVPRKKEFGATCPA